jgi:hypothetical protein
MVLAATEVLVPAAGSTRSNRLALIEGVDGLRILALVEGSSPAIGDAVTIVRDQDHYVAFVDERASG